MNKFILFVLCFLFQISVFGQEICDNGIDDDGDGLIDLNDDECECSGDPIDYVESLIPNPDFELMDCCPSDPSQLTCASSWQNANGGTPEYYNECDYLVFGFPFAGGDSESGFVGGFMYTSGFMEAIGTNELISPFIGGETYILSLMVAEAWLVDLDLSLYGSPNVDDLPWDITLCPIGIGDWELLANEIVIFDLPNTWQLVTIEFTPTVDINAFAIGGACGGTPENGYFFFDNLNLFSEGDFIGLEKSGSWCNEDLTLFVESDEPDLNIQWYKDGVALLDETNDTLFPMSYGLGTFSYVYTYGAECFSESFTPIGPITSGFEFDDACFPAISSFENISEYSEEDGVEWFWDFDDGLFSEEENPTHLYDSPGTYDVTLIVESEDSTCNDTTMHSIDIFPKPIAEFDFSGFGMFTFEGEDSGCTDNPIDFEDASSVADPSTIEEWFWDFGDGTTSEIENPTHSYVSAGDFDVTLIVITESGCKDTAQYAGFNITSVIADFTDENGCTGDDLLFDNISSVTFPSEFDSWEWDYGDGGTGITEDGEHIYAAPGIYDVELIVITESGCSDTVEKMVDVYASPIAGIEFVVDGASSEDGITGGCYTSVVQFIDLSTIDPSSAIVSWNWNFGDGSISTDENPTHLYTEEGLYTIELIVASDHGCESTITIDILMTNGLAYLTNDTTICQNGTASLHAGSSDGSPHIYNWSIPDSDNSPDQIIEGLEDDYWVYVTAENAAGCISPIDSILITVLEPITLEISPPDTACIGDPSGATVIVVGGRGDYTYTWTANGIPVLDNVAIINTNPISTTEYCVTVEDGCETDPVTICTQTYVPEYPSFTSDTTEGCEPTEIIFTDLTGPAADLNSSTWYINGDVLFGNPVNYTFEESGSYSVKLNVLSPEGCTSTTEITNYITIHPLPTPALYISPNPTTYFNTVVQAVNISPNISSSFYWSTPGALTTEAVSDSMIEVVYPELVSGDYKISIVEITEYGCIDSAQSTLVIYNDQIIYAPNAFTPGGDNMNQTWGVYIEGINIYNFHLRLYDRWGELIWESYNPSARWDGTLFDQPVQDGVYVWVIQAKDLENDKAYEFKGFVTVIR